MSIYCSQCKGLQRIAIEASRAYHELQANLEAAHIRHDLEDSLTLSRRLERGLKVRDASIKELTDHEGTHREKARPQTA